MDKLNIDGYQSLYNAVLVILPRLLLVIFIEIFAYFFLRLYKDGLSEIKYFQNELTNIEAILMSAEISYLTGDKESLKLTLAVLAKTERNYVLKKGETTVELERAKSDSEMSKSMISGVSDFMKNVNKK